MGKTHHGRTAGSYRSGWPTSFVFAVSLLAAAGGMFIGSIYRESQNAPQEKEVPDQLDRLATENERLGSAMQKLTHQKSAYERAGRQAIAAARTLQAENRNLNYQRCLLQKTVQYQRGLVASRVAPFKGGKVTRVVKQVANSVTSWIPIVGSVSAGVTTAILVHDERAIAALEDLSAKIEVTPPEVTVGCGKAPTVPQTPVS